jgi:hypothetical protein
MRLMKEILLYSTVMVNVQVTVRRHTPSLFFLHRDQQVDRQLVPGFRVLNASIV